MRCNSWRCLGRYSPRNRYNTMKLTASIGREYLINSKNPKPFPPLLSEASEIITLLAAPIKVRLPAIVLPAARLNISDTETSP